MSRTSIWVFAVVILAGGAIAALGSRIQWNRMLLRLRANAHGSVESQEAIRGKPVRSNGSGESGQNQRSCVARDLRLRFPVQGTAEKDWVIANYVDLEPASGLIRDYTGATGDNALTYDGHTGIDFEVPSFREVDQGFPVIAAADGVVEETFDQSADRNRTCSSEPWNYVKLRHANGFATVYGHLKKNSLTVAIGDHVSSGQKLGVVGSSGCSSYPHVHLEVLDCIGQVVDMMQTELFLSPPVYSREAPTTVMEVTVFQPAIDSFTRVQDPGPRDTELISSSEQMSVGVTISHLHMGDTVRIDFLTPENSPAENSFEAQAAHYFTRSHWWGNFRLDMPGPWIARVKVNGQVMAERPITVVN